MDAYESARRAYDELAAKKLTINMTRGVPSLEQEDIAKPMLYIAGITDGGVDLLNYGHVFGLPSARAFFAEFLGAEPDEVIVGNNSSLQMMYDVIAHLRRSGVPGDTLDTWQSGVCSFICPVPGYDRHFKICEDLGIHMHTVDMTGSGPDMRAVRELAKRDHVLGMWCTPMFSNPTGATYSDDAVRELASMEANPDFRIFWDRAYDVHALVDNPKPLLNIRTACTAVGNPDRVIEFCSTSKITFAGGGVAALSSSRANIAWFGKSLQARTIGPDKLNQYRHVRFLRCRERVIALMKDHRKILKPKFDTVDRVFSQHLRDTATWTKPAGGYFISLQVKPGCARRVVELSQQCGVELTAAGAPFPYGRDPRDSTIRIAPSYPSLDDVKLAAAVIAQSVILATHEHP